MLCYLVPFLFFVVFVVFCLLAFCCTAAALVVTLAVAHVRYCTHMNSNSTRIEVHLYFLSAHGGGKLPDWAAPDG